jgi:polyferredoxin
MHERNSIRKAEILSVTGAAALGAGLALLLERWLSPVAVPLLVLGALTHGFAMLQRRRLEEHAGVARAAWEGPAYWLCWIALVAILLYAFVATLELAQGYVPSTGNLSPRQSDWRT